MTLTPMSTVWVQLTEKSEQHLREQMERYKDEMDGRFLEVFNSTYFKDGWYETSLGDLMMEFGSICHGGNRSPFKMNEIRTENPNV